MRKIWYIPTLLLILTASGKVEETMFKVTETIETNSKG